MYNNLNIEAFLSIIRVIVKEIGLNIDVHYEIPVDNLYKWCRIRL